LQTGIQLTFLGTSTAVPDPGSDTAHFLINKRILVDTGWSVVENLRRAETDPTDIDLLLFTHLHHDHYMALPALLFYLRMKRKNLNELTIAGPAADVEHVVKRALDFLQHDRFFGNAGTPRIMPLQAGQTIDDEEFVIRSNASVHPVEGLSYRFEEKERGIAFTLSGDTAFHPPLATFAQGSRLLVHEASLGPVAADPNHNPALHSGAIDAGNIAKAAEVDKLVLVHGPLAKADTCVAAAKTVFANEVIWPANGETVII
jgi:ribonuclease Z